MRDPGTPGRNPFFDHGPDAELGDLGPDYDELGTQFDEEVFAAFPFLEGPDPTFSEGAAPGPTAPAVDPLGTLAALVDALQGAQPEATEHLVAAAHELVLAVKTVVDATEAVLAAQRAAVGTAAARGRAASRPVQLRPGARVAADFGSAEDRSRVSTPRIAVGVDIGGTKVLGALVDERGTVLQEHRVPSPDPWPDMRDAIVGVINVLRDGEPAVRAVGVGAAGMIDLDGVIHYAPNVPGFRRVPIQAALAEATGLPTIVDNDANVAAYGEIKVGVARGLRDALVVTLGTGIGGGVIVEGKVLRGANGFAAEIGHFQIDPDGPMCACGERGHWEAMASGNALGRMAREAAAAGDAPSILALADGVADAIDGHHVSEAARAGEPDALALVDQYSFNVAIGLVGLANIFDPALIAISGGLVRDGELFLGPMRAALPRSHRGRRVPADSADRPRRDGRAGRCRRGRRARVGSLRPG